MELTAILEGMPSGIPISIDNINFELSRRQRGFGSSERMKLEHDTIKMVCSSCYNKIISIGGGAFENPENRASLLKFGKVFYLKSKRLSAETELQYL